MPKTLNMKQEKFDVILGSGSMMYFTSQFGDILDKILE